MEPLRRSFRGYEPAQVDRLVSGLYSQLEARLRELEEVRLQNARLNDEISPLRERDQASLAEEKAIREALVSAHRQADEVLAQARKEADLLLHVARETANRYQEDLRGRIDDLNWQIERLTLQKQRFHGAFRELLEGHLSRLTESESASTIVATAEAPDAPREAATSESEDLEPMEPEFVPESAAVSAS